MVTNEEMKGMMAQDMAMVASVARITNEPMGVATQQHAQVAASAVTPGDLLRYALDSGADLDRLEKLMDLQVRFEADQARKAFADDMARFKAVPIEIIKNKRVEYKTDNGGTTSYMHATIGNVVETVAPMLATFGFSHRWDLQQRDGLVIVTCVITHKLGHSQSTTLMANPDQSGKKNGIQSIISAKTYLERHTLLAATGLATKDQEDDDGDSVSQEDRQALRQDAREMRAGSRGRAKPADVAAERAGKGKPADGALLVRAQAEADKGHMAFGAFWKGATDAERRALSTDLEALQQRASTARSA